MSDLPVSQNPGSNHPHRERVCDECGGTGAISRRVAFPFWETRTCYADAHYDIRGTVRIRPIVERDCPCLVDLNDCGYRDAPRDSPESALCLCREDIIDAQMCN